MIRYLRTGAAVAAFLMTPIAAPAVDLSVTAIYQGRPPAVASTGWALADRWMISSDLQTAAIASLPAPAASASKNRNAWSSSEGYTMLTRWSLKGDYVYVNFLDPGISDPPTGSTTIAKTNRPLTGRALKVGGNFGF
jgi:hypothetical protein